jgi:dipeptidyl aminopeptidase/acylaminoacyl peptidase
MDTGTGTGDAEPRALTSEGTAHTLCPLPDGRLVFSKSTMAHPSEVYFLGSSHDAPERRLTRIADAGLKDFVLEPPREVWFAGAEGRQVHGWVLLPPGFERGAVARYPVCGGVIAMR